MAEGLRIHAPDLVWLAANYHLPGTYSCRVPMNSAESAQALPGPGPATVRLALVRAGIELSGLEYTRDTLFPIIAAAPIQVRPPERIALSVQRLHGYKVRGRAAGVGDGMVPSLRCREMAHALGALTVYVGVPRQYVPAFRSLLEAIGYWGQTDSLAACISVDEIAPHLGECVQPVQNIDSTVPLGKLFSSVLTEFRDTSVSWDEIVPDLGTKGVAALRLEVYIWPLLISERRHSGIVLFRRSLN